MARNKRKSVVVPKSRKAQPDPYTAKIKKVPSKRELEDTLRHAVNHHDFNALEDYDEQNPRPAVNAVAFNKVFPSTGSNNHPDGARTISEDEYQSYPSEEEQRAWVDAYEMRDDEDMDWDYWGV